MASSPSSARLSSAFQKINAELKVNSELWKPRAAALTELEKLVAEELNNSPQDADEILTPLLFGLSTSLITQITDLRSEIVKQAAHTISFLAENVPVAFNKSACKLIPALFQVASGTNGVIRTYADPCVKTVVKYIYHANILTDIFLAFKQTKAKIMKQLIMECLVVVMAEWPTKYFKKSVRELEETIILGLQSSELEARKSSGAAALYLNDHFPGRFKAFMQSLDARGQKIVLEVEKSGHEVALRADPEAGLEPNSGRKSGRRDSLTAANAQSRQYSAATSDTSEISEFDAGEASYGSHIEIIEPSVPLESAEFDEDYKSYLGQRGVVITTGELDSKEGEWLGIRLDTITEERKTDGEEDDLLYIRRKCAHVVPQIIKRTLKSIDTSAGRSALAEESPSSARSNASVGSAKHSKQKSIEKPLTSPLKTTPTGKSSLLTPTRPTSAAIRSPNIPTASKLPQSRLVSPNSTNPSKSTPTSVTAPQRKALPSKIPTPTRSREASPERDHKPPLSRPISAPIYPPINRSGATGPSTVNFHQAVASGGAAALNHAGNNNNNAEEWNESEISTRDRMLSVPCEKDLPQLVRDHRAHVAESAIYLQQLNDLLNKQGGNPHYTDHMIKLLSEHLSKTTRLLEGYMKLKRRTINAAKIREEQDDFLDRFDNFNS
jgi:hypothetical protein